MNINLEGKALMLTVGRQVKRKGHEWFIKEVIPKIESPFIYLAIGDGPEHETLNELVSKSPYKEQIVLAGRQPDDLLKQAYAAADLFYHAKYSCSRRYGRLWNCVVRS